ncbi:MAG: CDP-diacylglycerol--glycerol-3-phosphate 3-phosphatidyltransferase [Actinomycetaceae bacterium]|nr:CDP-diacylglycerol--glycerol-3-phosphate 3-phosphatidyltransferase [Actinomycetaceae bacterium]
MSAQNQVSVFNIANVLTIVRLILIPIFIWLYLQPGSDDSWAPWAVFAIAAITDQLDGHLARKHNLITDFGKLADSIADKALIISALLVLSWDGTLWWWVTIVFIVRELGITLMRMFMVKKKVMAAGMGGKIKMVAQSFGIAGLLIPWHTFLPSMVATGFLWACYALIAIALFFAITSAVEYIREAIRISRDD